jgi:TolB-like protein
MSPRSVLFILALMLFGGYCAAAPRPVPKESAANLTIAVADFAGADKELGRFIAETLLTNLTQSQKLNLVERTEIRQALAELKLQSSGLVEPQQVKKLGSLVSADRLIVGSYLVREDQIIINARLLDVKTGRLAPGGAASVSGKRGDLLSISQKLARQFHKRVTGSDLNLDGQPIPPDEGEREKAKGESDNSPSDDTTEPATITNTSVELEALRAQGWIPRRVRPNGVVTEQELLTLVGKVSRQVALQTENPVSTLNPTAPVTRIRALAALVKLIVAPGAVASYREGLPDVMPPDTSEVPAWGRTYLAAAVEQGVWKAEQPIKGRQSATWTFVGALLSRMAVLDGPPVEATRPEPRRAPEIVRHIEPDPDAYTGLIVDAYDLPLARAMSPRILDESGRVVYPDPKHLPDYDYLLDKGLASYCESARDAKRAGRRPLIVRGIDIAGNVNGDIVVTNRTAERIREANRRGQFLARWSVCFLISPR